MQVYWLKHKKRYIIFGISSNTWKWLHIVYEDDKLWNDYKPHLHMYTLNSSVIPLQTNVIFTSIYTILFIPYIFSHTHIHVHMYFISVFLSECEHEQVFLFYLQIKLPFIKKEEKKKMTMQILWILWHSWYQNNTTNPDRYGSPYLIPGTMV